MPYTQIATDEHDYILIIGDGTIESAEELFEWSVSAVNKALELGRNKLLFDNRTLTVEVFQYDTFEVANRLADMDIQRMGLRFAVLSSRKTLAVSNVIETAFVNRSAVYKRFDSKKEALQWLLA